MDDRKHIIIAGVPRAGKTTLCNYLAKSLKYQHLTMDAVSKAFEVAFPEVGVVHTKGWGFIETSNIWIEFLAKIVSTKKYDKLNYKLALDLFHITPQDYSENIDKECCEIYFLGYPNISVEEKFNQVRKFDTTDDWTRKRTDETLKEEIKDYIDISKWLKNECYKYNLPFIDVSKNRDEILKEMSNEIINKEVKYMF